MQRENSTNRICDQASGRSASGSFKDMFDSARSGDQQAIGQLIEACRNYLLLVANDQLDRDVQGKIGPSDIVQESMMAAQQGFQKFTGDTQQELLAWLRGIVMNGTRDAARHFKGIQKRQIQREVNLHDTAGVPRPVVDQFQTPGTEAVANEESKLLEQAMSKLRQDYQQVLRMRNWQQLSFNEIGEQMERSPDAVRKLWSRALLQLEEIYGDLCK